MDSKTIGMLVLIGFILVIAIVMFAKDYKFSSWSYLIGWFACMLFDNVTDNEKPKHITIEKSSDSEWVKSEKDFGDTTVINVWINKHEGKTDTIFSTTEYRRIDL